MKYDELYITFKEEIPEGYTLKYFGEQESQVESNEALAKNLPLTFFLMFTTLLLLFKTYRKPTVILLMLPLIFIRIHVWHFQNHIRIAPFATRLFHPSEMG